MSRTVLLDNLSRYSCIFLTIFFRVMHDGLSERDWYWTTHSLRKTKRETMGAYHLARKSGNFGLKSNGKVIFRKFRSKIVEYLQRYSSFSVRNGMAEISLPFAKLSSFQSLISRKQLREIEVQMVSAISFGWFADFGKTLTIIQRSSQPVYSDKW